VISLYYYLKVVKAMYLDENDNPIPTLKSDFPAKISLIVCFAGVVLIGIASVIYEKIGDIAY
jgi:NADH-quinone oxidoreductase subunit N